MFSLLTASLLALTTAEPLRFIAVHSGSPSVHLHGLVFGDSGLKDYQNDGYDEIQIAKVAQEGSSGNLDMVLTDDDGYVKVNGTDLAVDLGESYSVEGELVLSLRPTKDISIVQQENGYYQLEHTEVNNSTTDFFACPDDDYKVSVLSTCSNAIPIALVHIP